MILETLVELDFVDRIALLVGEVVELGFELVGVDPCDLGEGGDCGREEDEQTCADEGEVDGAGERAGSGDVLGTLQELECERRQDKRRDFGSRQIRRGKARLG